MHLVSDPQKYAAAQERGALPFFYTACGRAEPVAHLTVDPRLVSCVACQALINRMLAAEAATASVPESEPAPDFSEEAPFEEDLGFDDDDFAALDEVEASFDLTPVAGPGDSESSSAAPVPSSAPSAPAVSTSPFEAFQPMLEDLFKGFDVDPLWQRWTMTPEEDPKGSDGMLVGPQRDYDPREILEPDQAAFVTALAQLSSTVGLEGLSSRVLTLIHQIVMSGVDDEVDIDGDDARPLDEGAGTEE